MQHFEDVEGIIDAPKLSGDARLVSKGLQESLYAALHNVGFQTIKESGKQKVLGAGSTNHWLRLCISNPDGIAQTLVLRVAPAITAEVDLYPSKLGERVFQTGNALAMNTRDRYSSVFDFNLELEAGESQIFYLRVMARTTAYLVASVWSESEYLVSKDRNETLDGIFIGVFLGLILYTVLLYFSVRGSASLLYISWCLSILTLLASIDGRVLQYLLPNHPNLAYTVTVVFYPVSLVVSALFARNFIGLNKYHSFDRIGIVMLVAFLFALGIAYQFGYTAYFRMCAVFALSVVIYFGLISPVYLGLFKGSRPSQFLLLAQAALIVCALDRSLFAIGVTGVYYIPYTPKVGLVLGMILLAYFMGLVSYSERNQARRKALQQELKSQQLRELNEEKSLFFANVSHEFRTPLTLILGPLSELLEKDNGANTALLKGAIAQSKSLQDLVDQLLMLSQFDNHKMSLHCAKLDINRAVAQTVSQFDGLAKNRNITLNVALSDLRFEAYIDREKIQLVLKNLLSNALKFTPSGGTIEVVVSARDIEGADASTDRYFEIIVNDSGYGLPREELEAIFDRFFQSSSSILAGSGSGTGIGLALVRELVELHAGRVYAQQRLQETEVIGTAFTIQLPFGSAHLTANEIVSDDYFVDGRADVLASHEEQVSQVEIAPKSAQNDKPNILVVDDNVDMRHYLRDLLQDEYQIRLAVDGRDAEKQIKLQAPELLITDLMMPRKDGIELVRSLRSESEFLKIPVIMLTAKSSINDRLEGLTASVDDYLAKPFDARELRIRIRNLLKKQAQFSAFYSNKTTQGRPSRDENGFIARAREEAEKHMRDPLFGVKELAECLHVSRATLRRRLQETSDQLATEVGFSQGSYFSRLYQKTFNSAPLAKS